MTDRVKISVMGITHSQIQKGAYAVLLTEDGGPHRIPVVVGIAEAQSIVAWMERVNLPRPLTHDLFRSVTRAFGIRVKEVFVSKFEKGIFYSEITFADGDREVVVDARTSDALAIALRSHAPIYTTREVIDETGFIAEGFDDAPAADSDTTTVDDASLLPLNRLAEEELQRMLAKCISTEEYERAAEIKAAIDEKRRQQKQEKSNKKYRKTYEKSTYKVCDNELHAVRCVGFLPYLNGNLPVQHRNG